MHVTRELFPWNWTFTVMLRSRHEQLSFPSDHQLGTRLAHKGEIQKMPINPKKRASTDAHAHTHTARKIHQAVAGQCHRPNDRRWSACMEADLMTHLNLRLKFPTVGILSALKFPNSKSWCATQDGNLHSDLGYDDLINHLSLSLSSFYS